MPPIRTSQEQILDQLNRQIEICTQALPIAEDLAKQYDVSPDRQLELEKLEGLMQAAATEHAKMTGIMDSLAREEQRTDDIRRTSARLATKMARLIELFGLIEDRAMEVRQRMFPELNQSLRAQKMHAAYSTGNS